MTPAEHRACFDRWMAEHPGILHRVANAFASGADRRDLHQEMMLALWKAVPAFRGGSKPSTFMYRVAHNTALTWRRGHATYRRHVERYEQEPLPAGRGDASSLHDERDRDMLERVYAEIRQLPPVDRSLILLHFDGLPYAEIAAILGLSESNVGARLSRTRQRLIQALQPQTSP